MIDFPASPTDGQKFTSGNSVYTYNATLGVWTSAPLGTARPFNYAINGAGIVSQQNGSTAGTTNGYFMSDQNQLAQSLTGGAVTGQRVAANTPRGSQYRHRMVVTTAQASMSAANWFGYLQSFEGQRMQPFAYGNGGNAKRMIVRFGFKGPAGTWSTAIRGVSAARCYTTLFTISAGQANTDTEQVFSIPGCTDGTWAIDNTRFIELWITFAAGSTYISAANDAWQTTGTPIAGPGISNGMATNGNTFEIFDIGLYIDPGNTDRAPLWEAPNELESTIESQRYWYKMMTGTGYCAGTTVAGRLAAKHPTPMRAAPTETVVGTPTGYDQAVNNAITFNATANNYRFAEANYNITGVTGTRCCQLIGNTSSYIAQSARV